MNEVLLSVENLRVEFQTDEGIVKALNGVSFEIQKGKILGLVGESGCGKTVTANAILRLIPQPPGKIIEGKIIFENEDLLEVPKEKLRTIRGRKIAMIFQDPFTALNPVYTVGDQIAEAIQLHQGLKNREALHKAAAILETVGIPDASRRIRDYPHQFSGGMAQRVMIAMALSCNPTLLIADEPTSALDVTIQAQILELMAIMNEQKGTAILLISHDLGVISEMCEDVAIMYAGNIVEIAETESFFSSYRHPYSKGLLESIPRFAEKKEMLSIISGNVPNLIHFPSGCPFHPRCSYLMERCKVEKPRLMPVCPRHKVACFQ